MLLIISYDNIRHMSEKLKYLNSSQEIEKKKSYSEGADQGLQEKSYYKSWYRRVR